MLGPCLTCTLRNPILDQPTRADVMLLSDYAGENEVKRGRVLAGRSGSEIDRLYLPKAGLSRNNIYCSNAFKCQNTKKTAPKHNLVSTCAEHWLPWEMRRVQPKFLIVAGSSALKLFPGKRLELHHGRPFIGSLYRTFMGQREAYWTGTVIPTYNPAAGLRSGDYMTPMISDFRAIGYIVRDTDWATGWGKSNLPVDPFPNPDYRLLSGSVEVADYCSSLDWVYPVFGRPGVGLDTETVPSEIPGAPDPPYCMSFSLQPGTGAVIMAGDQEGLDELYGWMETFNPVTYIHNILFDWPVFDQLHIPYHLIRNTANNTRTAQDTMIRAYHQKDLPRALKVLSYRKLGASMRTFDEVVLPHSVAKLSQWLGDIAGHELQTTTHGKWGQLFKKLKITTGWDRYRLPKQTGLSTKALALRDKLDTWLEDIDNAQWEAFELSLESETDSNSNPGNDTTTEQDDLKSPWSKIKDWPTNLLEPAIEIYGPPPAKSIANVPPDEMITYACRDADMALRLGIGLLKQREVIRLHA